MAEAGKGPGLGVWRQGHDVRLVTLVTIGLVILVLGVVVGRLAGVQDQWRQVLQANAALAVPPQATRARAQQEIRERFQQGVWMLNMKQYDHALTAFHRVLQLDPALPEAHVNAGFALLGQGKPALARGFFQAAADLNKDQLNAYWGLALALEAEGDLEKAIGAMRVYAHLSSEDDPFRRRAWAALWEWENKLKAQRAAPPPATATR